MSEREPMQNGKKREYHAPEVKRVALKPEEAVLGFCKQSGTVGALQPTCNTPTTCFSSGS